MKITFNCNHYPNQNNATIHKEENFLVLTLNDGVASSEVFLTEKDLFLLIGQLLRIQSEIRKEVKNG